MSSNFGQKKNNRHQSVSDCGARQSSGLAQKQKQRKHQSRGTSRTGRNQPWSTQSKLNLGRIAPANPNTFLVPPGVKYTDQIVYNPEDEMVPTVALGVIDPPSNDKYPPDSLGHLPSPVVAQLFKTISTVPSRAKLAQVDDIIAKNVFKCSRMLSYEEQTKKSELWDYLKGDNQVQAKDQQRFLKSQAIFQNDILPNIERLSLMIDKPWAHILKLIVGAELSIKKLIIHFAPSHFWDDDHPLSKNIPYTPRIQNEESIINDLLNRINCQLEELTILNARLVPPKNQQTMVEFIMFQAPKLKSLVLESISPLTFPYPGKVKFDNLEVLTLVIRSQHCLKEFDQKIFKSIGAQGKLKRLEVLIKLPEVNLKSIPIWLQCFNKLTHFALKLNYGRLMINEGSDYFRELEKDVEAIAKTLLNVKTLKVLKINVECREDLWGDEIPKFPEIVSIFMHTKLESVQKLYFVLPFSLLPTKTLVMNPVFPVQTIVVDCVANSTLNYGNWKINPLFSPDQQKVLPSVKCLCLREIYGISRPMLVDIRKFFPNLERLEIELRAKDLFENELILNSELIAEMIETINVLQKLDTLSIYGRPVKYMVKKQNLYVEDYIACQQLIQAFIDRAKSRPKKLHVLQLEIRGLIKRCRKHPQEQVLLRTIESTKECENLQLH